jgi:hypothetical protein
MLRAVGESRCGRWPSRCGTGSEETGLGWGSGVYFRRPPNDPFGTIDGVVRRTVKPAMGLEPSTPAWEAQAHGVYEGLGPVLSRSCTPVGLARAT